MEFKDHFSKQSETYLKYRPHYPAELFSYLSSLTPEHGTVWDCGTGNGQAAIGLAAIYKNVIATDPSVEQIRNAIPRENVIYLNEKAESTSISSNSVDLITIANALHWFDFELFYTEARRVSKHNGIIAAWAYVIPFTSQEIDQAIKRYHNLTLNDYWLPENRLVEKEYSTIPFPFEEVSSREIFTEQHFDLDDLIGYLNSWSATQRFIETNKINPTEELRASLLPLWNEQNIKRKFTWKLILKVGRIRRISVDKKS